MKRLVQGVLLLTLGWVAPGDTSAFAAAPPKTARPRKVVTLAGPLDKGHPRGCKRAAGGRRGTLAPRSCSVRPGRQSFLGSLRCGYTNAARTGAGIGTYGPFTECQMMRLNTRSSAASSLDRSSP